MIPDSAWSQPWISSDTCMKHQSAQAEIDLRDWLAGKPHDAFDALKAVYAHVQNQGTFLEIACGCGYDAVVLAMQGHPPIYTGVDISIDMVDYAIKTYGHHGNFLLGRAEALPFMNLAFDCACLAAVIQHLPDYRPAIQEAIRVSKRWIIIHRVQATKGETNEFVNEAYGTRLPTREICESELLDFCGSAGLMLVHAHRWGDVTKAWNASLLLEKS